MGLDVEGYEIIGELDKIMNDDTFENCTARLRSFDYTTLLPKFDAWLDTPTAELFLDIFLSFPKAKVILTTRPADEWVTARKSWMDMAYPPIHEPCGRLGQVADGTFTDTELAALFTLLNELV